MDLWKYWANALRYTQPSLLAYLLYMMERLVVMKGLLRPAGSIYLHCDPTASHYIKVMMDGIFGHKHFMNEIVWYYRKWTNAASYFQKNHDIILAYAKNIGNHTFNKVYINPTSSQQDVIDRG